MKINNMNNWKSNYMIEYRTLFIEVKQDFGDGFYLIDGMPTNFGYIVTDRLGNVMPGAIWFQTVKQAKRAIDLLILTEGDPDLFHSALEAYNQR